MSSMRMRMAASLAAMAALTAASGAGAASAGEGPAQGAAARKLELARPGTFQEYIDKYTGGEGTGCSIGGQVFRNFQLPIYTSVDEDKLEGPHPMPPLKPEQILVTPVNYVKDGRRWVGFRFTNTKDGLEILGGPKNPKDFPYEKGHEVQNCGFLTNYSVRFEVHGTSPWQQGKVAYADMSTACLVDGEWNETANTGPGSRANMGWTPRKIGAQGGYDGFNPRTPQSDAFARLSSISRQLGAVPAARANENWFEFFEDRAPTSFELRTGYWPDYSAKPPGLGTYGIWFRINCWDKTNTRWRADYIEHSFSNATITDEIWTPDGKNRAAPPAPLPEPAQPIPATLPAPTFTGRTKMLDIADGVQMKFVEIPASQFVMGSPNDERGRCDNEGPQRVVTISKPFYMGVCEVTQAQYEAVMGNPASQFKDGAKPADRANTAAVLKFCKKVSEKTGKSIRLPTEAEWEYAARTGSRTPYSFGDDEKALDDHGWYWHNSGKSTHPVGEKKPNAWGLYDMHGNVWELCSDFYADSFVGAQTTDPKGPETGEYHVLRGGSWSFPARGCRSASRMIRTGADLDESGIVGFRVVFNEK